MNTGSRRRGFTIIELIFAIFVGAGLIGFLLPALGRARSSARQIKCSVNVRGMHQGMVLFAQNNNENYPLPSILDKANNTFVTDTPAIKDQPKNILSCLMFSAFFGPELCVSPAESNPDIEADKDFEYSEPAAAKEPKLALWDPRFRATPGADFQGSRAQDKGNLSYAHSVPFGARRKYWSNTFMSTEAIIGNRGPWYELAGGANGTWALSGNNPVDALAYPGSARAATVSNTLLIHGGRTTWEGNVAYNDNHVEYQTRPDSDSSPFTFANLPKPKNVLGDNLFADENDKGRTPGADSLVGEGTNTNLNAYLRQYAGGTVKGTGKDAELIDLKGAWFAD